MMTGNRIAELTWQVQAGDYTGLRRLIEANGGRLEESTGGTRIAHSVFGGTMAFSASLDPTATVVLICRALFGDLWAELPDSADAMKAVNKAWTKARTKARKEEEATRDRT